MLLLLALASPALANDRPTDRALQIRQVIERSSDLLQQSAQAWAIRANCSSCHHQMLGTVAVALAAEKGFDVDRSRLAVQVGMLRQRMRTRFPQHVFGLSSANPAIGESYALWALEAVGEPAGAATDAAIHALAARQSADGHWPSVSHQPPFDDSPVTATALTLRALRAYAPPGRGDEMRGRIARAAAWLEQVAPRDHEETVMRVLGLYWAGAERARLEPALEHLRKSQRLDGGWAQNARRQSDAYATGQALVALHQVGEEPVEGEVYRRGVDYLLASADGSSSWHVPRRSDGATRAFFDSGYPHGRDQYISYAGACWATMALSFALEPAAASALSVEAAPRGRDDAGVELPPLVAAALFGSLDQVRARLDAGDAVDARGPAGITALAGGVWDAERTALLLARGADPRAATEAGLQALHVAAYYDGAEASIPELLAHGADLDARTPVGATPLYLAMITGRAPQAALLRARGARPQPWRQQAGARVTANGGELPHPLLVAVQREDLEMASLLLDGGENADGPLSTEGLSALESAVRIDSPPMVDLLLAHGADPDRQDAGGRTPLHWAAVVDSDDTAIVDRLLAGGADPSIADALGKTPAQLAADNGHANLERVLEGARPQN